MLTKYGLNAWNMQFDAHMKKAKEGLAFQRFQFADVTKHKQREVIENQHIRIT